MAGLADTHVLDICGRTATPDQTYLALVDRDDHREETDAEPTDDSPNAKRPEPAGGSLKDAAERKDGRAERDDVPPTFGVGESAGEERGQEGADLEDRDDSPNLARRRRFASCRVAIGRLEVLISDETGHDPLCRRKTPSNGKRGLGQIKVSGPEAGRRRRAHDQIQSKKRLQ